LSDPLIFSPNTDVNDNTGITWQNERNRNDSPNIAFEIRMIVLLFILIFLIIAIYGLLFYAYSVILVKANRSSPLPAAALPTLSHHIPDIGRSTEVPVVAATTSSVVEMIVPSEFTKNKSQLNRAVLHSSRPYLGHVIKFSETTTKDHHQMKAVAVDTKQEECLRITQQRRHESTNTSETMKPTDLTRKAVLVKFGHRDIIPLDELFCPICLVEYDHGDLLQRSASGTDNVAKVSMKGSVVVESQCDHIFHQKCITQWMESNGYGSCPMCRRSFRMGASI
jgi:RING-H2 zinc finger domain